MTPVAALAARPAVSSVRGLTPVPRLKGRWIRADEMGYAMAAWPNNARWAGVRPLAIAMCADDEDVRKSIAWARVNDKPFAIRSGGHSYAGFSTTTGVLIDVKPMNGVRPLSGGVRSGRVVCALPDRIECAGHGDDPAADREAALPLNGQRRHACGLGGTRRYEECRRRDGAPFEDVQA